MADKLFPARHKTLGTLRDAGLHLHAFCLNPGCGWHADLDIDLLINRLGRVLSAQQPDLVPRLYCNKWGSRKLAVELSAGVDVPDKTAEHLRRGYLRNAGGASDQRQYGFHHGDTLRLATRFRLFFPRR